MAHNEEKVIRRAIASVLTQKSPMGYSVKAFVVANGCNDRTEEMVTSLQRENPDQVELLSIMEKGKTRAINTAIDHFRQLSAAGLQIVYVIFLDADCEFNGDDVLVRFLKRFKDNPDLAAVGAHCVPDALFDGRKDLVADIYRTVYKLGESLQINSISGMCYAIKYPILNKIEFPNIQFNEDMYVSSRLDGWFLRDRKIQVVFRTPNNLKNELRRRTRQEVSTQRYHEYYSFLKGKGIRVTLQEKPLHQDYRWFGATDNHLLRIWPSLKGIRPKMLIMAYGLMRLWAKINAYFILRKVRTNQELDFWKIVR